ncbi:MAG: hypothetical protein RQ899_14655 [Pseudomonadales bacterium]|nr:hypothetical protein [Pseudomonadales bacterium]
MRDLTLTEVDAVSAAGLSFNEAATLILALGAAGTMATLVFAIPIAASLYFLSPDC